MNKTLLDQEGQSTVEIAICVPALILLLYGMVQVTLIFHAFARMDHACFIIARFGIVHATTENWLKDAMKETEHLQKGFENFYAEWTNQTQEISIGMPIQISVQAEYQAAFSFALKALHFNKLTIESECVLSSESETI